MDDFFRQLPAHELVVYIKRTKERIIKLEEDLPNEQNEQRRMHMQRNLTTNKDLLNALCRLYNPNYTQNPTYH